MLITPQNSAPEDKYSADLARRLEQIRERMRSAAADAGRDVRSITLLAVSKGQELSRIRAALTLGMADFGENYVDEALPKIRALAGTAACWHFIGRLQGNKTRAVAENFAWVHGVDRLRIAERLSAQRPFHAPALNLCVQVHIAADPAKGGVMPPDLLPLLRSIAPLPRVKLRGLMCILPLGLGPEEQMATFRQLAGLARQARAAGLGIDTLSMGMSADFEAAIQAGATIVRIGTALFGNRA
jgi:hypothetical protein